MRFFSLLSPYAMWIKIGLAVAAVLYVTYLNARINYLKSDNAKLEAKNALWEANAKILANAIQNQNDAVENMRKQAENAHQAAQKALLHARKANTIRKEVITAATARILIEKPSTCESAIDDAKKDLQR